MNHKYLLPIARKSHQIMEIATKINDNTNGNRIRASRGVCASKKDMDTPKNKTYVNINTEKIIGSSVL